MSGVRFCEVCLRDAAPRTFCLEEHPVVVCGEYVGALRRAVLAYKMSGRRRCAGALADLMARTYRRRPALGGKPWLVEVPSADARRRYRGFNPAGLLADELADRLGFPRLSLLGCSGHTPEQKSLPGDARRLNPLEGFHTRKSVQGPCLLIDDVITTGTTARRCLKLLHRAGASRVAVLAVASAGGAA